MSFSLDDTIAALASAPGPALRGIIRLSGRDSRKTLGNVFRSSDGIAWQDDPHSTSRSGWLQLGRASRCSVELYRWPGRRSYTGEPAAELHLIGSPPILELALRTVFDAGARPARPGEFTLRAFIAGRIDLLQAEAVIGVVDAHDHAELSAALLQLAGGLSGPLVRVREDLIDVLAELEAGLDFVDEDIRFIEPVELAKRLQAALDVIDSLKSQTDARNRSTGRAKVVLAGLPNAGKSTLFNALVGRHQALVSAQAGTTRDYLSAELDFSGVPIELIDTAGWESLTTGIGGAAQDQLRMQLSASDLVLWCTASDVGAAEKCTDRMRATEIVEESKLLCVTTKSELQDNTQAGSLRCSAATGQGLKELTEAVARRLGDSSTRGKQWLGSSAARCRDSLEGAARALDHALEGARSGSGDEMVSIDLRDALEHLGHILGQVYTDDILDRIFSKFCIGK